MSSKYVPKLGRRVYRRGFHLSPRFTNERGRKHWRISFFTAKNRYCLYLNRSNPRSERWASVEIQYENGAKGDVSAHDVKVLF